MQQQIQINQPPERILSDAASFFVKRRAKVSDRSERGFRFGLPGGASEEPGTVTIAPGSGGASTVTVRADGIGLLAIAESFVRELRKQARDQDRGGQRTGREGAPQTMRGDFSALRERLGMPPPERAERPERPERQDRPAPAPRAAASNQSPPAAAPTPEAAGTAPTGDGTGSSGTGDGRGGDAGSDPPRRAFVGGEHGPPQAPTQAPEEQDKHNGRPPSAEQSGGVPRPHEVQAAAPSDTAKAHSGAGSPERDPSVDPSTAEGSSGAASA